MWWGKVKQHVEDELAVNVEGVASEFIHLCALNVWGPHDLNLLIKREMVVCRVCVQPSYPSSIATGWSSSDCAPALTFDD